MNDIKKTKAQLIAELEEKKAELKKVNNEFKRKQNIFFGGPVVVIQWINAENWPVEYITPNIAQFGYQAKDFTSGKRLYIDIIHPEDLDRIISEVEEYKKSGEDSYEQEYRIIKADGEVSWVYDYTIVRGNDQNEITHFDSYIMDITERKQAEKELRESEERFKDLAEMLPEAAFETDRNLKLTYANRRAFELFGYSDEDLTRGLKGLEMFAPESRDRVKANFTKRIKGEDPGTIEYQALKKDGSTFPVFFHANSIMKEGELFGLRGIIIDITERKKAEEKIINLAKFPSENPNPVLRIDADGKILYNNEAVDRLLEMAKLSRKQIYKILPNNLKKLIKKTLETGEIISDLEVYVDSKIFSYWMTPVVENQYINLYGRNITESKKVEKRQKLATQILEQLNKQDTMKNKIHNILVSVKENTGFEAVGIRLKDGNDFPYYCTKGFPADFVEAERYLCSIDQNGELIIDSEGKTYLECMCGNVISGRTNPSLPFFTEKGSFWTNSTTDFLASTTEEDRQSPTRNRCNSQGYESVALISLNSNGDNIGLLQLNDSRKDMLTLELINFFEEIGASIGITFSREQSKKALNSFSEKYRSFVQNFHGIAFYRYANFEPIFLHGSVEEITGYTEDDFINGKVRWDQIIYPDDMPFLYETLEEIHSIPKHSFEIDYRIICKNGMVKYVHEFAQNICDDAGKPLIVRGAIYDITERKKAQEELLDVNERYNRLTDNADEAIFRVKAEGGNVVYLNAAAERIFGYSMADWLADPALGFKIIHPDFREKQKQIIKQINTNKKPIKNAVLSWIAQDGHEVIMEYTIIPILDKKENVTYFESIGRDITERKKAEDKLKESEEKYSSLFNTSNEALMITDNDTMRFIDVNQATLELYGYSRKEFLKLSPKEISAEPDKTKFSIAKIQKKGKVEGIERLQKKKDGTVFPTEIYGSIFNLKNRKYIIGQVRDITKRKQAEEQLIAYQQNLRSLASELSNTEEHERQRIARYLHDQISQSLAVLRINIDELKEIKDYKLISEKADHIQSMLGKILKDSRTLTFDLSPPILHVLGFEPAIEWIVEKMSEDFNLPIIFENDAHPKPVEKDIGMFLYRSTKECLTNAIKHAQVHSIKVNIIREGDYIRIIIEDDGIGFDTSILKSLTHSVGFGLFSIRERIEYIGGNLLIESESDKGTKIIMSVPLKTS